MDIAMRATSASVQIGTLALLAFLAGCASKPEIRADADPTANLASYQTFGFFDGLATDKSKYSTMITARLKDATRREMQKRGYQEAPQNPQLLVNFNTNVQSRTEVHGSPSGGFYGYRSGMYGAWSSYPSDVYTTQYKEGTLAIDIVDAGRKQLVWQGIAQARVTEAMLNNPTAAIDSIVTDIFGKYPVPAKPQP
jgi:Domain of unknown function (DUF4136)